MNLNVPGAGPLQSHRFFVTASPDKLKSGSLWGGAAVGYARAPLTCRTNRGVGVAVDWMATTTAYLGGQVGEWFQLSLAVPGMIAQANWTPQTPLCPSVDGGATGTFWGLNDPAINATLIVRPMAEEKFSLAVRATGYLPVMGLLGLVFPDAAPVSRFLGDDWGAMTLSLNPGYLAGPMALAAELGVTLRPSSAVLGRKVGSGLTGSLAASVHAFLPDLFFIGEIYGRAFADFEGLVPFLSSTDSGLPFETMLGVKYRIGDWGFSAGAGTAILSGPGTSDVRVLTAVAYGGPKPLARGPPILDLRELFRGSYVVEGSDDVEMEVRGKRKRRKKKPPRDPPCPDYETLTDEEKLFLDPDCLPPFPDADPYANVGIDELLCEEVIEQTVEACEAQPRPLTVERVAQVKFALNAAEVEPGEHERVRRLTEHLPAGATLTSVTVVGHADALGTPTFNIDLATQRATFVRELLVSSGIPADRVKVSARGAGDPLVGDLDAVTGAPANRRVEVIFRYQMMPEAVVPPALQESVPEVVPLLPAAPVVESRREPLRAPGLPPKSNDPADTESEE